jgi:hypothetical protein
MERFSISLAGFFKLRSEASLRREASLALGLERGTAHDRKEANWWYLYVRPS